MEVLGITGMNGSGKETMADELVKTYGFIHYSSRKLIEEVIDARGITSKDRDTLRRIGNEVRDKDGAFIPREYIKRATDLRNERVIIESIRTKAEIDFLTSIGANMFAVNADQMTRYLRIKNLRSLPTDDVDFENFVRQEYEESHSMDPKVQNLLRCWELTPTANRFMNDGTPEEFIKKIRERMTTLF